MRLPFLNHNQSKSFNSTAVPAADEMIKSIRQTTEQAIENLKRAQETQSFYSNKKEEMNNSL